MNLKGRFFGFCIILSIVSLVVVYSVWNAQRLKIQTLERQVQNLKIDTAKAEVKVFRDSLCLSTSAVQEYKRQELKDKPAVKKIVEEVAGTSKVLESMANVATCTADTLLVDSMRPFHYCDQWVTIAIRDSFLVYQVRDSLTTIVTTEYKHHFLWWRWGKKGYRVSIVSHNPNSKITYNNFIKIVK